MKRHQVTIYGGNLLTEDEALICSTQPFRSQEGASSSSSSSSSSLAQTGLSPPPPYSWESSAPLLLPPEGASSSSSSFGRHQEPLLQEPFSGHCSSYRQYGTAQMATEISRWEMGEIERVASSLGASILADPRQEPSAPFLCQVLPHEGGSTSSSSTLAPWPEMPPEECGAPFGRRGGYQRKTKMYQLGPQEDPEMEKRRKNAIKQHRKRLKDDQFERNQRSTLDAVSHQVNLLKEEKTRTQRSVARLQEQLARLSGSQAAPYGDLRLSQAEANYFYQL